MWEWSKFWGSSKQPTCSHLSPMNWPTQRHLLMPTHSPPFKQPSGQPEQQNYPINAYLLRKFLSNCGRNNIIAATNGVTAVIYHPKNITFFSVLYVFWCAESKFEIHFGADEAWEPITHMIHKLRFLLVQFRMEK